MHNEDHDTDECPRCRLRRMLTTALTSGNREQFASLLQCQLEEATRMMKAIGELNTATMDDTAVAAGNDLLVDLAVEELIETCDRVYQVADGSDLTTNTMPAGRYWVGDLCSVLGDVWDDVPFDDGVHALPDGRRVAKFHTVHGDGVYDDNQGNEYAVDSGSLGCIMVADIRDARAYTECGAFVTAAAPFVPRRVYQAGTSPGCDGGVLHLAGVQIQLDHYAECGD